VNSLSWLTPSAAGSVSTLCLSECTVSWCDIVTRWFNTQLQPLLVNNKAMIHSLLEKYLPPTLEFIRPCLLGQEQSLSAAAVREADSRGLLRLESQKLKLAKIHVVRTCCIILQVQTVQ